VTDWNRAADDYLAELGRRPAARAPATIGEIWDTEWKATGLDTTFGVQRPMMDAYSELQERLTAITGKDLGTLARERRLDFLEGGFDGRVQTMGRIIDSLPDPQQKLLADYKDVRGRARMKAAEIEKQSADVAGAIHCHKAAGTRPRNEQHRERARGRHRPGRFRRHPARRGRADTCRQTGEQPSARRYHRTRS